jgi:hypothetical protein
METLAPERSAMTSALSHSLAQTSAQISAQLDLVLAVEPEAQVIAINSPSVAGTARALDSGSYLHLRGRRFTLRWCESQLALRAALVESEQQDQSSEGMVLLTAPGIGELANDIIARLAKHRVFQPEGWPMVRQLFGAKEADARLGRYGWLPQLLLNASAQGPYAPVAHGFLDLDTVWKEFLWRYLQLDSARPDAAALLAWSMGSEADASLKLLPANAREACLHWLEQAAGVAGKMICACIAAGRTGDALALGLVCDVLYSPEGEGEAVLAHAQIRLERFVNEQHVGIAEGRAWAEAAQRLLAESGQQAFRPAQDRADHLLRELRVEQFAHLSRVLPQGFEQRMRFFAHHLQQYLDLPLQQQNPQQNPPKHAQPPAQTVLDAIEQAASRLEQHGLAASQSTRLEKVAMARRIVRWLHQSANQAANQSANQSANQAAASKQGVAQILCWQSDEGAFVDWARFRLLGGDELPEVSQAYARLRSLVGERRHQLGQQFALALPEWNRQALTTAHSPANPANAGAGTLEEQRLVPLEAVLERVLAPLAAQQAVLLLVLDGLSTSIFRELFNRMEPLGYREVVPAQLNTHLVGVAAFPTITEVSRASLLCGKLTSGGQQQEKAGFASHPALLSHCNASAPPRLFHKGELSEASNLAESVRNALANPAQKVLGIVFNAVDDHLSGPEQLRQRWQLDDLLLILPILREARAARRAVLICADHGHILNDNTMQVAGQDSMPAPMGGDRLGVGGDRWVVGGDRWVAGDTLPPASSAHALVLRGGRVVAPRATGKNGAAVDAADTVNSTTPGIQGAKGNNGARVAGEAFAVTCLWSEAARFGGRKNGYHGGVAPQEVAVPLALLLPANTRLTGWEDALPPQPEWWDQPLQVARRDSSIAATTAAAASTTPARKTGSRQASARDEAQLGLFAAQDALPTVANPAANPLANPAANPAVNPVTAEHWIDAVLNSPIYASQHALAARVAPPPEQMRKLLAALDERGGKLSRAALAQKLGLPEVRLNGMLSGARRILNVDQASVLVQDEASATVEIKRTLLLQQFEIKQGGRS